MLPRRAERFLEERYGGKRALLSHLQWRMALHLGRLDRFGLPGGGPVERVVFLCAGNICRSAYAHARARMWGVPAASCGIAVGDARRADPVAARQAALRGVDLSRHVPTPVSSMAFREGDLVAVMEPGQGAWMQARFPGVPVTLLGSWAPSPRPFLKDPYGLSADYFQRCFAIIDHAVERLMPRVGRGPGETDPRMNAHERQ